MEQHYIRSGRDDSSWSGSERVSVEIAKWNEIRDTLCPIARATAVALHVNLLERASGSGIRRPDGRGVSLEAEGDEWLYELKFDGSP